MYYHGVVNGLVTQKVLDILKSGAINSASQMGYNKKTGFNEADFISICAYLGESTYLKHPNNAFNRYILKQFCFIINGNIEIIKPEFIEDISALNGFDRARLRIDYPDKRFSDIIDEYQVRGSIPLENIIALGIPYDLKPVDGFIKLSEFCYLTETEFQDFILTLEKIASDLGLKVVNSCDVESLLSAKERDK